MYDSYPYWLKNQADAAKSEVSLLKMKIDRAVAILQASNKIDDAEALRNAINQALNTLRS